MPFWAPSRHTPKMLWVWGGERGDSAREKSRGERPGTMHSRGTLAMGLPVFPARGGPVSALFGATSVTALAGAPASLAATFQHNPFGFGVIYAACDLLIPLNLGLAPVGGALYGLPKALLVVLVAGVIAAAAAFSIGRKCRDRLVGCLGVQWAGID